MATGATFINKFNNSSTGLFKDNAAGEIGADDARALVTDIDDNYLNFDDDVLDEDDMSSDSATQVPTQQSVKAYVDAAALGIVTSWKAPVVNATTANITLSGEQTIDGVLTSASRILVKNQSTQSENGIYVTAAGAWARSSDANLAAELEGAAVTVQQGTANANTTWIQTTDGITLGSSNIVWSALGVTPVASAVSFTPAGSISATDVQAAIEELDTEKAPLASPTFTGTPTAPTVAVDTDTTQIANTEFVQEQKKIQTVAVTGTTYELVLTDAFKKLEVDNAAAVEVTVPLAGTVAFEVGTMIAVNWYGVCGGSLQGVTIAPEIGVTINSSSTGLTIQSRYSTVVLEKIGTNEWNLYNGTPPTLLPIVVAVPLTTVAEIFTNQANSQLATAAPGFRYDLANFRQIKLSARVGTASASANTPRLYLLYSTNDGSSYSILGQGTVASGEAISLGTTGYKETVWYDIPVGAHGDVVIRSAVNGGDGVADPNVSSHYVHLKQ
jgi:hypothetical protein